MSDFATITDVKNITGIDYDADEQARISALLPLVSDLIRTEGAKVGKNIDTLIAGDEAYASVVKLVTCDVVARVLRQSQTGDPMAQESQAALGYTWSGTYAIPGGGAAMSLMNNEKKILGLRRQQYGGIDLWQAKSVE